MTAFDASSEKTLGTHTDHEEHTVLGLVVHIAFQEVISDDCEMVVRVGGFKPWDTHVSDLLRGCFMEIRIESGVFHVMWAMEWRIIQ